MKKWLWKLTGGRPMKFIRAEFFDHIVSQDVNSYMDKHGRYWFAFTPWTWNRLRMRGDQVLATLHREKQDFALLNQSPSGFFSRYFSPCETCKISDFTTKEIKAAMLLHVKETVAMLDAATRSGVSSPDDDD